jgi:hypothetical protein
VNALASFRIGSKTMTASHPDDRVDFRFRFVREGHRVDPEMAGAAHAMQLTLGDVGTLDYRDVEATALGVETLGLRVERSGCLEPRLALLVSGEGMLVLAMDDEDARRVKAHVDRTISRRFLDVRHTRTASCPVCGSLVDLSDFAVSRFAQCPYCRSVTDTETGATIGSACYGQCPECGRFDRVQTYTELHFRFYLLVYMYGRERRKTCDSCARQILLRALLRNLVFLIGVPTAVVGLIRASTGRLRELRRLPQANRLAAMGRRKEASAMYAAMARDAPCHPGVLVEWARAEAGLGETARASELLDDALRLCANYGPALDARGRLSPVLERIPPAIAVTESSA